MYDFLKNLVVDDPGRVRIPKTNNPSGGPLLRVFASGFVYPSKELVDTFLLEYTTKDAPEPGFGIDFFLSADWTPLATHPKMLVMGFVPKTEAKVSLFGSCRYNEDGTPKASVLTQGVFSPELLRIVEELGYLTEGQKYVDLQIVTDVPINTQSGIAYVPKVVARGERKGEATYERRENVTFYPVNTPENLKGIETKTETTPEPNEIITPSRAHAPTPPAVAVSEVDSDPF